MYVCNQEGLRHYRGTVQGQVRRRRYTLNRTTPSPGVGFLYTVFKPRLDEGEQYGGL